MDDRELKIREALTIHHYAVAKDLRCAEKTDRQKDRRFGAENNIGKRR